MTYTLHKSNTRGSADHGWLKAKHSFSFASYQDPERMGFGALRVINDDVIAPSKGFATHPHNNMEIITVPLGGALEHKDTMGNEYVIRAGEVQAMSAGSGLMHSEYNHSSAENVNLLQIWVMPKKLNIDPNYSQKEFDLSDRENKFQLIVSPDGVKGSVNINQDAYFSLAKLDDKTSLNYSKYKKENGVYLFVIDGKLRVNDHELQTRDGLGIENIDGINLSSLKSSEVLIMEVPMKGYGS